jgi:hypothetical protein
MSLDPVRWASRMRRSHVRQGVRGRTYPRIGHDLREIDRLIWPRCDARIGPTPAATRRGDAFTWPHLEMAGPLFVEGPRQTGGP